MTITAKAGTASDARDAVAYKANTILKVSSQNGGVAVSGDGVTDLGDGRYQLDEANWLTGARTVTLKDSTSTDEVTVSIVDSVSSGGPYTGALDSTLFIQAAAASKIVANAPATVDVNEEFKIGVERQDKFGNVRVADSATGVEVIADQIGVEFSGDKSLVAGVASFTAKSSMVRENVQIRVIDGTFTDTLKVAVVMGKVDGPDELVAEDYMGADGLGDQGGFVMLTWDLSKDKGVDTYRIFVRFRSLKTSLGRFNRTCRSLHSPSPKMLGSLGPRLMLCPANRSVVESSLRLTTWPHCSPLLLRVVLSA